MQAWYPVRLTKELLVFYQRSKSSYSSWRVRGRPLPLPQEGSGGHSLETLDLDSRLAIGPKAALADDYRGRNSVRFVSMELGHRILETEKPQKPKKRNV